MRVRASTLCLLFVVAIVLVQTNWSVGFGPEFFQVFVLIAGVVLFYWLMLGPTLWVDTNGVRNERVYVRWNTVTRIHTRTVLASDAINTADGVVIEREGAGRPLILVHTYGFRDSQELAVELERWWRAAVPEPGTAAADSAAL